MSAYMKPTESDQLALPSDSQYWVRLKRRAMYADQLAAQSAVLHVNGAAGAVSPVEWGKYIQALMVSMILEWNLTDENDQPLPVTPESINRLETEDGEFLASQVTERAGLRGVEQERPFGKPPSTP